MPRGGLGRFTSWFRGKRGRREVIDTGESRECIEELAREYSQKNPDDVIEMTDSSQSNLPILILKHRESPLPSKRRFKCLRCSYSSDSKTLFQRHMRLRHVGSGLAIFVILALPLLGQSRLAHLPVLPDDRLTPGVIAETDAAKVCVSGYSKTVRHTSGKLKAQVYREYGITKHKRGAFQVDHRIPLGLGGGDMLRNVWSESCETHPGCHEKDALELRIHEMVCHEHSMTLEDGQRLFAGNWIEGYRKYLGDPETRNDAPEN